MLHRAGEREAGHARGCVDFRPARAVPEGIGGPGDPRPLAEFLLEIAQGRGELTHEGFSCRQIGVRLDERSTDDLPAPLLDALADPGEGGRIGLLDVLVDEGFATDIGEFRKFLHEPQDGAAGGKPLVGSLSPVPKPDGIQMRIGNQVELHNLDGNFRACCPVSLVQIWIVQTKRPNIQRLTAMGGLNQVFLHDDQKVVSLSPCAVSLTVRSGDSRSTRISMDYTNPFYRLLIALVVFHIVPIGSTFAGDFPPGFDPVMAKRISYNALDAARRFAGPARTGPEITGPPSCANCRLR